MAAALCYNASSESLGLRSGEDTHLPDALGQQPINFLYGHLHNAIRSELDGLTTWALSIEAHAHESSLEARLAHLKERYHFLEQVYKYHSSVEDEVHTATRCERASQHFQCIQVIMAPLSCVHLPVVIARPPAAPLLLLPGATRRCCRCCRCCCHAHPGAMQVVYPALETKVKNVTSAYSVEHQDEVRWFAAWVLTPLAARRGGGRSTVCLACVCTGRHLFQFSRSVMLLRANVGALV
jgi:hypothetical protein